MGVIVPKGLPAAQVLRGEGLQVRERETVLPEGAPQSVQIVILNLMPTKEATETQLLRVLGGTKREIEVTLLAPATHESKNTAQEHIERFYTTFDRMRGGRIDGLIVTGAPVEMLAFEQVDYWEELAGIMDWARQNIRSTYYICWAAQAAMYRFFGIRKYPLEEKCFGIFEHSFTGAQHPLLRGVKQPFLAPHSRHTQVLAEEICAAEGIELLAASEAAGVYLAAERDGRSIFVTGHSEYDADTLKKEYDRDVSRGLPIRVPVNYYPGDDPEREPPLSWRGHSKELYGSWIENIVCG